MGKNLEFISQDSCVFYNDVALYDDFGGVAFKKEEGVMIAKAMGNCKAGILRNHGLLTVGSTIDSAVLWFVMYATLHHSISRILTLHIIFWTMEGWSKNVILSSWQMLLQLEGIPIQ